MAAAHSSANITISTIEDQMRQVDKVIKDCDASRKTLEKLTRRLDELYDEVRRYREYLAFEKGHRDPALYKTNNVDRPSVYNDQICGTMSQLTTQLTQEWADKLRNIHGQMQPPMAMPPSPAGSARSADRT
uniref:Uncharacterized protein n=1 Tax=Plectus sambesii TaxID=2011161 RepID=A0A914XH47_9BILA